MTDFLIKSTISLFVLLAVYHLVLEKEKMHVFNRFYLLFSLVFSFVIPFITIEIIKKITKPIVQNAPIETIQGTSVAFVEETNYLPMVLWSIYGLITFLLFFRFMRNIIKITAKTKSNTSIDYKNATLVLLKEKVLPHTFLHYIFINETDYNTKKIEEELFSHELTHVTQKHTLDVLFIEILKTIFWFNPLFIFYKKAIQLNHEFLADEKVVKSHKNVPFYQNLLLSKANANPTYYLASNLNYSVTKKRLIMMTKNTSAARALLKKGLLIPLLTALVFSLCTKVVAQETPQKGKPLKKTMSPTMYYKKTTFKIKDEKGKIIEKKKYIELSPKEKKIVENNFVDNINNKPTTPKQVEEILKKGGPKTLIIDEFDPKNIKTKQEDPNTIYSALQLTEKPEFLGGMEAFYKFVGENYKTPKTPDDVKLTGKVYVTYVIETNGEISNIKVLRDIGYGTGEEAIRVLKLSPKWNPGEINGEAVRTLYSLPIAIQPKA